MKLHSILQLYLSDFVALVLRDKNLSDGERIILLALYMNGDVVDTKIVTVMSYRELSNWVSLSDRYIRKCIRNLCVKSYVEKHNRDSIEYGHEQNKYVVLTDMLLIHKKDL